MLNGDWVCYKQDDDVFIGYIVEFDDDIISVNMTLKNNRKLEPCKKFHLTHYASLTPCNDRMIIEDGLFESLVLLYKSLGQEDLVELYEFGRICFSKYNHK